MRRVLLLALFPVCAFAQDAGIQRQLIQRQQQSDAFALQLRQSQAALNAAPARRSELQARQIAERQRFDNLSETQLRDVKPDTPEALRPYERQRADDERRALIAPVR